MVVNCHSHCPQGRRIPRQKPPTIQVVRRPRCSAQTPRWRFLLLIAAFILAACSGATPAVSPSGFRAGPNSIQQTAELQPSRVIGGKSVRASSIPACSKSDIVQTVSVVQRRYSPSTVQVIFTTTLRRRIGSAPCGIPAFQTCSLPGAIVLTNAQGHTVWQWTPPLLMRRCDPTLRQELPMSVSSPLITFVDDILPAGRYVVMTPDSSARTRFRLQ